MLRLMHKSKIHRATLTEANLNYAGSLTVDETLMEAADMLPNEKVSVVNVNTGGRLETYVITGKRDSGVMCLNGAAARLGAPGDLIIVISYGIFTDEEARRLTPTVVKVDAQNRIVKE
jgi:aspartate 1-decarboxylase